MVAHQQQTGGRALTHDASDCKARAKLSEQALRGLATEIGAAVEQQAKPSWLWTGGGNPPKAVRAKRIEPAPHLEHF